LLFLARALDGLTGGNVSVANAYLADISDDQNRNSNFGKMSVSANMGFILGPVLAGLLGSTILGERLPVISALVVSAAAVVIIIILLPESKPCVIEGSLTPRSIRKVMGQEHRDCYSLPSGKRLGLPDVLKLERIPLFLILYFLIFLSFNIFYTSFPMLAIRELGWSVGSMGVFFSVLSLVMVVFQGPILSRLSKRYSDIVLTIFGSVLLTIAFVLLVFSNALMAYIAAVFFAAGNGLMWPSFLAILARSAAKEHQGAVQGYAGSSGSLASIIGLVLGGVLFERIGSPTLLFSALIMGLVFFLMIYLSRSIGRMGRSDAVHNDKLKPEA
jgi:MFS family permease